MGQLIRECLFCGPFSGGVAEDSLFHIPGLAQAEGGFQFRGLVCASFGGPKDERFRAFGKKKFF